MKKIILLFLSLFVFSCDSGGGAAIECPSEVYDCSCIVGHWVAIGDVATITEDLGGCSYDVGYSWSLDEDDQSDWNIHLDSCGHIWESESDIGTYECSDENITAYLTEDDGTPYVFSGSISFSNGKLIITQNVINYADSGCSFTLDTTLELIEFVNDCIDIN